MTMKIYIPDSDAIDKVFERFESMEYKDLLSNCVFNSILLTSIFMTSGMSVAEVGAFADAVAEEIENALKERREKYS